MGYNLSAVSYLSLASELSGEKGRGKTIATMFISHGHRIGSDGISLSVMVPTFDLVALERAFLIVAASALTLGLLGLFKLEPHVSLSSSPAKADTYTVKQMTAAITENRVAKIFFVYLLLLLAALLGQDVLLEPFGAQAFGMTIAQTSRIISISSGFTLVAFIVAAVLEWSVVKKEIHCPIRQPRRVDRVYYHSDQRIHRQPDRLLHRHHPAGIWHRHLHHRQPLAHVRSDRP
jgi:MFS transporter, BCD family, chlorophyll transporter